MLKLTAINNDLTIYISARHIVAMHRDGPDRTRIYTVEFSADQWVKETPEEIIAMPEMVYQTYPPLYAALNPTANDYNGYSQR